MKGNMEILDIEAKRAIIGHLAGAQQRQDTDILSPYKMAKL